MRRTWQKRRRENTDKIIDSYLVGLGFAYNDDSARQFLNTQKEIEEQNEKFDQSMSNRQNVKYDSTGAKQSLDYAKKQTQANGTLGNSFHQLNRTFGEIQRGSVFGSFLEGIRLFQVIRGLAGTMNNIRPATSQGTHQGSPTAGQKAGPPPSNQGTPGNAPKTPKAQPQGVPENRKTPAQQETEIPIKYVYTKPKVPAPGTPKAEPLSAAFSDNSAGINKTSKSFDDMGKSIAGTSKQALGFSNILASIFGGSGGAAAGGAGAALGTAAMVTGIGAAIAAIVVAIAEVAKATYDMADNLSTSNTNIETMSAKLWITNGAAWQLNNTLSAMGKSTSDLNDIALNPTLRKEYENLQDYQKTLLQLPSDFKDVNEQWAQNVQTPLAQLKLTAEYEKEMVSYDLEKALLVPAKDLQSVLPMIATGMHTIASFIGEIIKLGTEAYESSPIHLILDAMGKMEGLSGSTSKGGAGSATSPEAAQKAQAQAELKNYNFNWANAMPSSSSVTNSTTSNTSNTSNRTTHNSSSVQVNVTTDSSNPHEVGQAVGAAVTSANSNVFLAHSLRGVS